MQLESLSRLVAFVSFSVASLLPLAAASGDLDTGFVSTIGAGLTPESYPGSNHNGTGAANAVALQSDGKIIAGGSVSRYNNTGDLTALKRLLVTGALDTSFNSGGTGLGVPAGQPEVEALLVAPDNKIYVGGTFASYNGTDRSGILRLNADGSLDDAFAPSGLTGTLRYAKTLALQSDGKLLVGGVFSAINDVARKHLARLDSTGALDESFNPDAALASATSIRDLAIQPDGKIIVAGTRLFNLGDAPFLVRLNADGSLDSSFTHPFANSQGSAGPITLLPDGKLVVAGFLTLAASGDETDLVGLNADGSLDTAFNTNLGSGPAGTVIDLLVQPDGTLLASGIFKAWNGQPRASVARFNFDGILDASFAPAPYITDNSYITHFNSLAVQPDGKLLAGGWFSRVTNPALETYNLTRFVNEFSASGAGAIRLLSATATTAENAGSVTLQVSRFGGLSGAVSVSYATSTGGSAGTAIANSDYTTTTGTLNWAAGEGGIKTITVPVLQDLTAESAETFTVTLSNPTGGATVPALKSKTLVTLRDDDSAPVITRQPASIFLEQGGNFTLSVGYDSVLPATLQWQLDPDGTGPLSYADIPGANAANYTVTTADPATHAGRYRVRITNQPNGVGATTTSSPATVSISIPAGSVDTAFTPALATSVTAADIDADGRFLVLSSTGLRRLTTAGVVDSTFSEPLFNNATSAVLVLPSGKILVGGFFDTVNGTAKPDLARLNTDGSLDTGYTPSLPAPSGSNGNLSVYSFAKGATNKYYVGFGSGGGLRRYNADGTHDTAFVATVGGNLQGTVDAVRELSDGRVLVAHTIGANGFGFTYNLTLLESNGTVASTSVFTPPALTNGKVRALDILPDGRIAIGGNFNAVNTIPSSFIALLKPDGTVDSTFRAPSGVGPDSAVTAISYRDGRLLVSGEFMNVAGQAIRGLARINLDGSRDTSFSIGVGANGSVNASRYTTAGDIFIAGNFTTFKGVSRNRAALLVGNPHIGAIGFAPPRVTTLENTGTVTLTLRRYGPATEPVSIAYSTADDTAIAGTDYLGASGTVVWPAGNSADKTVTISLLNDTDVEVSKTFRVVLGTATGPATAAASATISITDDDTPVTFNTQPVASTSLIDGASLTLTATTTSPSGTTYQWYFNGAPIDGATSATLTINPATLAHAGLYTLVATNAAGPFTSSPALVIVRSRPGRVSSDQVTPGRPSFNASPWAILALPDGGALVGGMFSNVSGSGIDYLVRIKPDGTLDTSFNLAVSNIVTSLLRQPDGKILVGGQFSQAGTTAVSSLLRLNADLTLDTAFCANVGNALFWSTYTGRQVGDIAMDSTGRIYIGIADSTAPGIYRYSSTGVRDETYLPAVNHQTRVLAMQPDDKLIVGGYFTSLAGSPASRLGRLNTDGTRDTTFVSGLGGSAIINDLLIDVHGRLFAAGSNFSNSATLAQLSETGSFASNMGSGNQAYKLSQGPDGKIVIVRASSSGSGSVYRIKGTNPLPIPGSSDGDSTFNVGQGPNGDVIVVDHAPDGSIWIAGNFTTFDGFTSASIVKLGGDPGNPGIVNQPRTIGAAEGDTAYFSVGAVGTGLSYQWFKDEDPLVDDTRVTGATTAVLKITDAEDSDDADYTVAVTGGDPETTIVSDPAHLHLVGAPAILGQPASVNLASVGTATFSANVLAATPASYVWTRNGVTILNGGRYSGANTATLVITGANSTDNGSYTLTVSNDLGTASTNPATLVAPANGSSALGFTTHPTGGLHDLGATVQLTAAATGNNGFVYQWKKDGVALSNNTRFSGVTTPTLTITNIAAVNAGNYTVTVTSPSTSATSNIAAVAVLAAPEFTAHPLAATRGLGGTVTFTATARGAGTLSYRWYHEGVALSNTTGVSGATTATLTLTDLTFARAGAYTLRATNTHGNATSNAAILTVERSPAAPAAVNQPSFNGAVHAIQFLSDGSYLVGGGFTSITLNGTTTARSRLVRIKPDGTLDTAFAPAFNGDVRAIAVDDDGRIFVGGAFSTITIGTSTKNRLRVARFTAARAFDSAFDTSSAGPQGDVYALAPVGDGSVYIGGSFYTVGTASANAGYVARLKASGALDTAFKSGANSTVYALLLRTDGKLYVGGALSAWSTTGVSGLALVSATGTLNTTFVAPYAYAADIRSLRLLEDGKLLAGGSYYFGYYSYLKKLNPGTGQELSFSAVPSQPVTALSEQADGKIFYGDRYGQLYRVSSTGVADSSFSTTPSYSAIRAVALDAKGRIYVGGEFTSFNGVAASRFVILNGGLVKSVDDPAEALESQTIAFPVLADRAFTTAHIALSATASSGLAVTFSVVSGPATISGNNLTLTGLGSVSVKATQAGNATYAPVSVTRTFTVTKASQTITFAAIPEKTLPTAAFTVSASASSGLAVKITVVSGPATVSGKTVTLTGPGSVTLRATQAGNGTYNAAPAVDRTFTVKSKPVITTQPKPATVVLGSPATFKVVATGTGTLTYQWLRNGKAITGATKATYSIAKTASTHAGDYTVKVTNSLGSVTSVKAKLAFGTKPVITKQPVARTVTELGSATFSVTASGSPAVTYQWRRNGANISGATSASYTISPATIAQAGDYTVVVKNAVGSVTSTVAKLTVNPAQLSATRAVRADLAYTGTVIDSINGVGPDSGTITLGSGGTYTYTRTTATTATVTYAIVVEEAEFTETESATFLLTFTSSTAGTYTSSGSYEGTHDTLGDYDGTFTGSGSFTLQP